ncbi:hypothetical protein DVS77_21505 [Mycolicibacterium moriokaense]|nr:hypothetical protein DVS77_21505 [Mycolicibacterium moriokaense]
MGLFGGGDESKWSVACEELTTDIEIALQNLSGAIKEIKDIKSDAGKLDKYKGEDKSVLETLAHRLRDATGLEIDELVGNSQNAATAATNLSRIVRGF